MAGIAIVVIGGAALGDYRAEQQPLQHSRHF